MFATQLWHASMFSERAVEGRRFRFGVPGYRGRAPSGFWVLLGGPKVPPRAAVLRKRTRRRIGIRIARNGRTTITSVLWKFSQPHLSLKRKVPLTVPKKPCGGPVPLHPPSAAQGDCGPPNAPSNPLGDGGRGLLRPRREASPLGRARDGRRGVRVRRAGRELSAEGAVPLGIHDSLNIDRVAGLGAKRHQAGAAALPSVWKQGSNTPLSLAGDGGRELLCVRAQDGGREILRPRREASPLGRARVGGCPRKARCH